MLGTQAATRSWLNMHITMSVAQQGLTLLFLSEAAWMFMSLPRRPPRMPPQSTMLNANARNTRPVVHMNMKV